MTGPTGSEVTGPGLSLQEGSHVGGPKTRARGLDDLPLQRLRLLSHINCLPAMVDSSAAQDENSNAKHQALDPGLPIARAFLFRGRTLSAPALPLESTDRLAQDGGPARYRTHALLGPDVGGPKKGKSFFGKSSALDGNNKRNFLFWGLTGCAQHWRQKPAGSKQRLYAIAALQSREIYLATVLYGNNKRNSGQKCDGKRFAFQGH